MSPVSGCEEIRDPLHYAHISHSYLKAAAIVWDNQFLGKPNEAWDMKLIVHPMSQLLGLALETSVKGMIVANGKNPSHTHDLVKLFKTLQDRKLERKIAEDIQGLELPPEIREANPTATETELVGMYRRHHIHIAALNSVYDRPFISRYPSKEGFMKPDLEALFSIATTVQSELNKLTQP